MTHRLPPLDTEDLTPWYEEDREGHNHWREEESEALNPWLVCIVLLFSFAIWSAIGFVIWSLWI